MPLRPQAGRGRSGPAEPAAATSSASSRPPPGSLTTPGWCGGCCLLGRRGLGRGGRSCCPARRPTAGRPGRCGTSSTRPREGGTWFDAPGTAHVLVWFAQAPGAVGRRRDGPSSGRASGRTPCSPGRAQGRPRSVPDLGLSPSWCPIEPRSEPARLAAGIRSSSLAAGRLGTRSSAVGRTVDLRIDPDGNLEGRRPR